MKTLILLAATAFALAAQTLTLSAPASVRPGTKVPITVTLAGTSEAAGVQWTFTSPAPYTVDAGAATVAALKTLSYYTPTGIAVVHGISNTKKLAPGIVATYQIDVPATATGTLSVSLTEAYGAPLGGASLMSFSAVAPLSIAILRREDLNSDGRVDSIDVQISVDQIQGRAPCASADLNGDGKCRIDDLQALISAAS